MTQPGRPFPDGLQFGADVPYTKNGIDYKYQWAGVFKFVDPMWHFSFVDEKDNIVPGVDGYGRSPKEAVAKCIEAWIAINGGGVDKDTLKLVIRSLDDFFNEDGSARVH